MLKSLSGKTWATKVGQPRSRFFTAHGRSLSDVTIPPGEVSIDVQYQGKGTSSRSFT